MESKRNKNFSEAEINILLKILIKYKHILESKKTDIQSNIIKSRAWHEIEAHYNDAAVERFVEPRTAEVLKTKYRNLKKNKLFSLFNLADDDGTDEEATTTKTTTYLWNAADEEALTTSPQSHIENADEEYSFEDNLTEEVNIKRELLEPAEVSTNIEHLVDDPPVTFEPQSLKKQLQCKNKPKLSWLKLTEMKYKLTNEKLEREIEIMEVEHKRKMEMLEQKHELDLQKTLLELEILKKQL